MDEDNWNWNIDEEKCEQCIYYEVFLERKHVWSEKFGCQVNEIEAMCHSPKWVKSEWSPDQCDFTPKNGGENV